jgi:glucuronosyltransferase
MRLLIFFTLLFKFADSANILAIFPIASASHNVVYRALTDALEERGHTLTIITPNPRKDHKNPNVVEIDFSFMHQAMAKLIDFNTWKAKSLDEVAMLGLWTDVFDAYFDEQFNHPSIKEMIRLKDQFVYDVIIVEFMNQVPWQAFALLFDAPVIGISSLDMIHDYHHEHGNVMNPILHPDFIFPFYENLSFVQRARVLRYYLWYHLWYKRLYNQQFDNIIKRHMGERGFLDCFFCGSIFGFYEF